MPAATFTYACCTWPATRAVDNWPWPLAATTASTRRSTAPVHRRAGLEPATGPSRPAPGAERNRHRRRPRPSPARPVHGQAPGLRPAAAGAARHRPLPAHALATGELAGETLRALLPRPRRIEGPGHPASRDWDRLEAQGRERLAQVRNLELLRALFRRPLEVWLLLDRALFLQERGYMQAGRFCEHRLTPATSCCAERSDLPTEPVDNFVDDL